MARGSIQKRIGKDGRVSWTAIVGLPAEYDAGTGKLKRKQKRVTADTKKAVELKVATLLSEADKGFTDGGKTPLGKYFELWIDTQRASLKPATIETYRSLLLKKVAPHLGAIRIDKLTAGDLQRFYAGRIGAGLSSSYVRQLHVVMHHALDDAVRWGLVNRNVVDAVDAPRKSTPEMQAWTEAERSKFLAAVADDPLEPLYRLVLSTGMRRGELLGLKWADVNLDARILSVRRTLGRGAKGAIEEGTPKSKSSNRRISLNEATVESLRRHREKQLAYRESIEPAWTDMDYVFTNEVGRYLHPSALARSFEAAIQRAGVKRIRFHDTRHTAATVLMSRGVHPKVVGDLLGHSSTSITMDRYSHVAQDLQKEATDVFDQIDQTPKPTKKGAK